MRDLGLVRHEVQQAATRQDVAVPAHLDEALLLEMTVRTLKNMLRAMLRASHREREDDVSE